MPETIPAYGPAPRRRAEYLRDLLDGGTAFLFADLENCTVANVNGYHRAQPQGCTQEDHRQDSKGTWWMPWHQESMKDVNGCDKPR